MAEKDNLGQALKLARAGFYVFPCAGKKALVKWTQVSSRDEGQIKKWWEKTPGRVAAIDCGKSGLIVIDCDLVIDEETGLNGNEAFAALCEAHHFDFTKVPVVGTQSGGTHFYFRQRAGERRRNATGNLPFGIDVRGDGGYVIAPNQIMADGNEYDYIGDLNDLFNAPTLPDWLAAVLGEDKSQSAEGRAAFLPAPVVRSINIQDNERAKEWVEAAVHRELSTLKNAVKHTRNDTLLETSLKIGSMIAGGLVDEAEMFDQLFATARQIGLGSRESKNAIRNGFRYSRPNPRYLPDYIVNDEEITPEKLQEWLHIREILRQGIDKKQRLAEGGKSYIEQEDGEFVDEDTGEVVTLEELEPEPVQEMHKLEYPQGLVGDIARWIVATSRFPQPELAIGAALGIVGTCAGRQFASPTMSGTHLYTLAMAETGTGKDAPLQAIKTILNAADMKEHLGPDEFASAPAVVKFIKKKPLSICPMDEFGGFMKRVMSKRGSTHENAIPKILRSMWSSSFATYMTPEAASYESVAIHSPAISIFGATTPGQFYSAMSGAQVEDGTLNRFLLIRGRDEVEEVEPEQQASKVPDHIIGGLRRIYNYSGETAVLWRNDHSANPTVEDRIIELAWCPDGVVERYKTFVKEIACLRKQNAHAKEFYVRTAEMALRIATIIAIGCGRDNVRAEDLEYGIGIAKASADFMVEGAADYMAENENQANAQKIIRALKAHKGWMKYRNLLQSLSHSIRAYELKDLLAGLCAAGQVEKIEIKTKTKPSISYRLVK